MTTNLFKPCKKGLPISDKCDEIRKAILENQVVIITGETGSGKTTQIPKICLAAGLGEKGLIGCCQPRRIAAVSMARRVSQELSKLGTDIVGFQIRFHHKISKDCKIKFMTDGILLNEIQQDPLLRSYGTVILDEAHERSINIDLLAGMLKQLLNKRADFKLIITSATMETEKFVNFFSDAPLIEVPGRSYPVEIIYENDSWYENPHDLDLSQKVANAIEMIRTTDRHGDILVFLPTEKDIFETKRTLLKRLGRQQATLLPLFARLPSKEQARVFRPTPNQKIVLATNVAETSLTVPGIRYVIDSGLARIAMYNPNTHIKALPVSKISKANAKQRAGRAGRVEKGICIRLYSQEDYESRDEFLPPEIKRSSLAEVILRLLALGQKPVEKFPFIDPPKPAAIKEGLHTLFELQAVDAQGELTPLGKKMARLPLDPRLARIIFQAEREGCLEHIIVIASALSTEGLLEHSAQGQHKDNNQQDTPRKGEKIGDEIDKDQSSSDFISIIHTWNEITSFLKKHNSRSRLKKFAAEKGLEYQRIFHWQEAAIQIARIYNSLNKTNKKIDAVNFSKITLKLSDEIFSGIHRSILCGFLGHVACKKEKGKSYSGVKGKEIFIHPSSCLFKKGPKWIVSAEQVRTSKLFARVVCPIDPSWIEEFAKDLLKFNYYEPFWDERRGEAVIKQSVSFYGLRIDSGRKKSLKAIDPVLAQEIFISQGLCTCRLKSTFAFNEHNKKVIEEIEETVKKFRYKLCSPDPEIFKNFFTKRLELLEKATGIKIVDEKSLSKAIKRHPDGDKLLFLDKNEIIEKELLNSAETLYPGKLDIDGQSLPLIYSFSPGSQDDGITLTLPDILIDDFPFDALEWLVPGFLFEKIEFILSSLKVAGAGVLKPYDKSAEKLLTVMKREGDFKRELKRALLEVFDLKVSTNEISKVLKRLPLHLVMNIRVVDEKGRTLWQGRNISTIKDKIQCQVSKRPNKWKVFDELQKKLKAKAVSKSYGQIADNLQEIPLGDYGSITIFAFIGLSKKDEGLIYRPFLSKNKWIKSTLDGLYKRIETSLKKELKYLKNCIHKDLEVAIKKGPFKRDVKTFQLLHKIFTQNIYNFVLKQCLPKWNNIPSKEEFNKKLLETGSNLLKTYLGICEVISEGLAQYFEYLLLKSKVMATFKRSSLGQRALQEIEAFEKELIGQKFPLNASLELINSLPRFIKAMSARIQRASHDPRKDLQKNERFRDIFGLYLKVKDAGDSVIISGQNPFPPIDFLIFEYFVMVFAPEFARKGITSEKKLKALLEGLLEEL